jgi:selenocysteine-specific elongation factor
MPIQRVFAKEGFGTIVTGVPWSGAAQPGMAVEILPAACRGRVKGLHAYGQSVSEAVAGHSAALNLTGLERSTLARGMVAVTPEVFRPGRLLTVLLSHLQRAPFPLRHRAPIRFYHGTAEIMGRVLLLEEEKLEPGGQGYAQVVLEEEAVAIPGDRFLLRHQSPMFTCAGGTILDSSRPKRKRFQSEVKLELETRQKFLGQPVEFLAHLIASSPTPKGYPALCAEMGLDPPRLDSLVKKLAAAKRLVILKEGEHLLGTGAMAKAEEMILATLAGFFAQHPGLKGMERLELWGLLRGRWVDPFRGQVEVFEEIVERMVAAGRIERKASHLALAGRLPSLDEKQTAWAKGLERAFEQGGLAPPEAGEVAVSLGIPAKQLGEILTFLTESGRLVEAAPRLFFHAAPVRSAASKIRAMLKARDGLTVSEIRQALAMNRKFIVPLLEFFDRQGITLRQENLRRLGPNQTLWADPEG